jgi:hypothetical protein
MKLFKQSGQEHFLMWAVCTLELQSLAAEGGPLGGGARMLQLAEALLRKKMSLAGLEGLECEGTPQSIACANSGLTAAGFVGGLYTRSSRCHFLYTPQGIGH